MIRVSESIDRRIAEITTVAGLPYGSGDHPDDHGAEAPTTSENKELAVRGQLQKLQTGRTC
jgi:hypothetical protein